MRKRVAMTVWISALIAGWLFWAGPGAAAAAPKAYVGLFKDDAVAVIDTAQNKVVGTIPVPKGPHGLVITPDGRKVYVSSDGSSTVSVIDTASDRVIATIEVGANPHGLAVSGDGRRVLAMGWGTNRVLVIDTATDRVTTEVPVAQPHNGTLSRDGSLAWVGSQQQGATALVRLDLTAGKETSRLALDKTPRGLELSPDGKRVFFTLAGVEARAGGRRLLLRAHLSAGQPGSEADADDRERGEHPAQHHDSRARHRHGHSAQGQGADGCHLSRLGHAGLLVQVPRAAGDGGNAQGGRIVQS